MNSSICCNGVWVITGFDRNRHTCCIHAKCLDFGLNKITDILAGCKIRTECSHFFVKLLFDGIYGFYICRVNA